jgi:hypothetical protein
LSLRKTTTVSRGYFDAVDERGQLFDAVRIEKVHRPVAEGHSPVRRRNLVDVELLWCHDRGFHVHDLRSLLLMGGRARRPA